MGGGGGGSEPPLDLPMGTFAILLTTMLIQIHLRSLKVSFCDHKLSVLNN